MSSLITPKNNALRKRLKLAFSFYYFYKSLLGVALPPQLKKLYSITIGTSHFFSLLSHPK